MPKCRKRRICREPDYVIFQSENGLDDVTTLTVDEYEAIRQIDMEGLSQEECAKKMCVARTTAQLIYNSARKKIAESIVLGKSIRIEGGNYILCDGSPCCENCCKSTQPVNYMQKKGENVMRIAVTYENGEIFQHFGKTESFKVYEVEDNKVVSSEVIGSNGTGHGALAGLLAEQGVNVLICGGIGGGAQTALTEAGIELCAGAQGNTDQAVESYLKGELVSSGANCDHHHHEEGHSCGSHEEGHSCGDSCGGGCGGCGGSQPQLTGRNVGKTCRTHYRGTFNDGTQFDSSYDRGEPLEFICGAGQMIRGFDAAVADMEVGQIIDVHLMPEEAYGMADPNAIFTMEIAQLPGSEDLTVGQQVYLSNQFGQPFPVKVTAKDEKNITFDANHEMAGKELNFKIELVEVK